MATNFDIAVRVVLLHEGGFVDNPNDHGGATNFGITQRTLDAYRKTHASFPAHVRDLTKLEATEIYRDEFWPPFAAVNDSATALALFDQAVLRGPKRVISLAQSLLGLKPDGVLGPLTASTLNRVAGDEFAFRFLRASHHAYATIVKFDPTQIEFAEGWEDRLFSLLDFIFFGDVT